jgi:uncharacterized protein (TIGR00369 family)
MSGVKMKENEHSHGVSDARSRHVTWQDPFISAKEVGTTTGLEFLQKVVSGELPSPPIAELLGFKLVRVESGFAEFEFEPSECHYNPIGVVHGGMAGVLLDSAMGCCVQTTLPAGVGYTTLEYKVNLVRAVTMKTGRMRAQGRVIYAGARIATAEGKLVDAADKLYAHATTTCMIFPIVGAGG